MSWALGVPSVLEDYVSNKEGYKCKLDGKKFSRKSNKVLLKHSKTHLDKSIRYPFRCDQCVYHACRSEMALDRHMKNHHGRPDPKPHVCPYCQKAYRKDYMLEMHINEHTGAKPFKCQECGMGFPRIFGLRKHLTEMKHRDPSTGQVKDENRIIPCAKCGKKFDTADNLMKHMRDTYHYESGTKPFKCQECGMGFPNFSMLSKHLTQMQHGNSSTGQVKNESKAKPFRCQEWECGMRFPNISMLREHKTQLNHMKPITDKIKDENKIKPCAMCGKKFDTEDNRIKHVRETCRKYEKIPCAVCGKKFDLINLLKHMSDTYHYCSVSQR